MTTKNQGQIRKSLRRNFSGKFEELNETTSSFVVRSFEDDIGWIACLMVDLWLLWSRIGLKSVKSWNRPGLDLGVRKVNHLHLHLGKFIMFRHDNPFACWRCQRSGSKSPIRELKQSYNVSMKTCPFLIVAIYVEPRTQLQMRRSSVNKW